MRRYVLYWLSAVVAAWVFTSVSDGQGACTYISCIMAGNFNFTEFEGYFVDMKFDKMRSNIHQKCTALIDQRRNCASQRNDSCPRNLNSLDYSRRYNQSHYVNYVVRAARSACRYIDYYLNFEGCYSTRRRVALMRNCTSLTTGYDIPCMNRTVRAWEFCSSPQLNDIMNYFNTWIPRNPYQANRRSHIGRTSTT